MSDAVLWLLSFILSELVGLCRHVYFVYLHRASMIHQSGNTVFNLHRQMFGSTWTSHIAWYGTGRHPCLLNVFLGSQGQTTISRQGGPGPFRPLGAPCLHRLLFIFLFIMVQSNPQLVNYTRTSIYQHLAGGLQGSKQQIECTEPTT